MKKFNAHIHIAACSLVWYSLIFFHPFIYAGNSMGETIDCTDVSIDFMDDLSLTPEERIQLMDDAFFKSLDRFELCEAAKKLAASSGKAGDNGGGSNNSDGDSSGSSPVASVAGSAMSGTQTPKRDYSTGEDAPTALDEMTTPADKNEPVKNAGGNMKRSNGKPPEDIPPAQNDDALAAQIRYAAENETDPNKSRQLWNEYRKYKGLPIK